MTRSRTRSVGGTLGDVVALVCDAAILDDGLDALRRDARRRRDQALRVRVDRVLEDDPARTRLDDLAVLHHDDALGALGGETEVVRDEEHRGALLLRQLRHVVEDDALHRHVERRGRLVGDEQLGVGGEADADQRALTHAARELVRILVHPLLGVGEAGLLQHLDRARFDIALARGHAVRTDGLLDLEADAPHGVEVRHRVLRDVADLATAHRLHLRGTSAR